MDIATQPAQNQVPAHLRVALCAIGFTATVAQVVLLRELFVVFNGNELSLGLALAIWLLWTAIGSAVISRVSRRMSAVQLLASLQIASSLALFASIVLTRSSRTWWNAIPGEVLGPVPIVVTALAALSLFCVISGALFATGARAYAEAAQRSTAEGGSSTYLLEAAGSALGGVLASIAFIRLFTSLQIAVIVAGVNVAIVLWLVVRRNAIRVVIASAVIALAAVTLYGVRPLELRSAARAWSNFRVIAVANSRYGNLAVVETEGNRSIIQNGATLFTVPDAAAAEEAVHFPLLEHLSPRSVLLIGGGLNGSVREIFKHASVEHIDYVELDPELLNLEHDFFPAEWKQLAADSRVHTHQMDGRLFVRSTRQQYDVIIVNLPEPQTAQLNRFYTEEFFREAKSRLSADGVLAFHLRGAEEYISPEMAEFLSCIRATLKRVFPDVVVVPGETVHFLAAQRTGILTDDPETLVTRLAQRGIQTTYVSEYYLPFRMARERIEDLNKQLADNQSTRINRDFSPIAYYFDVALWSGQFSSSYRAAFRKAADISFAKLLLASIAVAAIFGIVFGRKRNGSEIGPISALAVAVTGLTAMGTEVILLLGFQAVYGYVFDELALIIAGFMAGIALGSWLAIRQTSIVTGADLKRLLAVQIAITLSPTLVIAALAAMRDIRSSTFVALAAHILFPLLAVVCGLVAGYQFPTAMRVYSRHTSRATAAGVLYAFDLAGAAFGAVIVSVYLLPVFGFARSSWLILIVNAAAVLPLAVSAFRDRRTPAQ